jgi:mono/diheme cytochrome c family protein
MDRVKPTPGPAAAGARFAIALLAAAAALASSYGLSRVLRRAEARVSHQLPTPEEWREVSAPTSPALVEQGHKLFLSSCAHCHGADATGDEGPDLHGVEVSDRYIANIITRGIKGEMPSFRKKLGSDEIARLTAFVRSLN